MKIARVHNYNESLYVSPQQLPEARTYLKKWSLAKEIKQDGL